MIPVVHNIAQEEMLQELQGNKLTLVYEKLRVVPLDQLLDIGCRWPMFHLSHLTIPRHAPWLPSFLTTACAPCSYDKVSHVPATPWLMPCPCPCSFHARALSMPMPLLYTSWVSHSQNQVVLDNACIEKNGRNNMQVLFTICWTMIGCSYCRSAVEPECGGEGPLVAGDHKP